MPFSRSRSPESIARSSTCWCSPNAPDCQSILSTRVVLPWSTWATMATLRMSARVFMGMRNSVSGFGGWFGPRRRGCSSWVCTGVDSEPGVTAASPRASPRWAGRRAASATARRSSSPSQRSSSWSSRGSASPSTTSRQPHQHLVPVAQRPRRTRQGAGHVRAERAPRRRAPRAARGAGRRAGDSPVVDLAARAAPSRRRGPRARCAAPPAAGSAAPGRRRRRPRRRGGPGAGGGLGCSWRPRWCHSGASGRAGRARRGVYWTA